MKENYSHPEKENSAMKDNYYHYEKDQSTFLVSTTFASDEGPLVFLKKFDSTS